MNRTVRKYLRQVKRQLCCPPSIKREFLLRFKDELLYCEKNEEVSIEQLAARFGTPKNVATEFLAEVDLNKVSRFACTSLRFAYAALAVVLIAAISVIAVPAADYIETQQTVCSARTATTFTHPNGECCSVFWVRTQHRGEDMYWEYHSCIGRLFLTLKPKEADGTEPYAVEIYINQDGTVTHWEFGDKHMSWIKVHDTE